MERFGRLVPPMIRATVPERIVAHCTLFESLPAPSRGEVLERLASLEPGLRLLDEPGPAMVFRWQRTVHVLGLVRRPVDERVELYVTGGPRPRLELHCAPQGLHEAHAAGMGGVLAFTAATALTAGPTAGIAMLLAGSLVAFVAREHSMIALRRRLETLVLDLAAALWPGRPCEIESNLMKND